MPHCSIYIRCDDLDNPAKGPIEMQNVNDFTKPWAGMFAHNPLDPASYTDAARKSAAAGEAFAAAVLKAAESNAELTGKWTLDTISRMKHVLIAKDDAADYAQAAKEFTTASVESAAENIAAYTDIAKRAQVETAEIFLGGDK